ncbi:hypothetical protein FJT64_026178 [Amphibalanus amphitrite]|uniref:Uncharacterized protein n=1 Tax=Amphibalanus amphitrite TaxID=1232801 RepID=A0A6A4WD29_AMPAM|nr:uncharacterized protein LOC122392664 [Amphibalanus amphitrite]KAF0301560.1 hypothetical protein FJT64_026178 [Amphibalanus amphitrite]
MSRNNSFPPIEKRSSKLTASDLSGEMTIDQFLAKYSQLSATKKEEPYVSRTPSPMAAARVASNLRRTSIRRLHSSKAGVRAGQSPEDGARGGAEGGSDRPLSRSEQALLLTERSAVLLDLPSANGSDENMSNGDSARSTDRSGWHATKYQQSPSPDNRRGDKPPPPRRKSLLERWEEVQASRPRPLSGESTDSQFEDDAYPYRPRINTRGSSQETGFEPTPGDEAAQRPPSGVDSLATPRSAPRPLSSSSTGASSARSEPSDRAAQSPAVPPGHSLFDSGNVETIDDVIDSLLTSRSTQVSRSRHKARDREADFNWDQVDRSSHPVIETVRFPEPIKATSPPAVNEYERYGVGRPRPATSATEVLERLSQVMSTQRVHRGGATPGREEEHRPAEVGEEREETVSQRPPSGRAPAVLRSPRARPAVHRAPEATPLVPTSPGRRGHQPVTAAVGWHGTGPPKPPRLADRRWSGPPAVGAERRSEEPVLPSWLEPGGAASDDEDGRRTAVFELEPDGADGGGPSAVIRTSSPDLDRPPREAFCAVSPNWTAPRSRTSGNESDGLVDPTLTQRLLWRQILRWTAVTTSVLVAAAAVTLLVFLLL